MLEKIKINKKLDKINNKIFMNETKLKDKVILLERVKQDEGFKIYNENNLFTPFLI
jgi:hypothetical protein